VFFLIIYSFVRRLVGFVAPDAVLEKVLAENMVLRHQLVVETRNAPRPRLRRRDRLFFAALSRVLPRERWGVFGFSPQWPTGSLSLMCQGCGASMSSAV
jgi:putative transposase